MQNYEKRMREQLGNLKWLEGKITADKVQNRNLPKGTIRVRNCRGNIQLYFCPEGTGEECFVPRKEWEMMQKVVQMDYEDRLLRKTREMQNALKHFLKRYDEDALENVYDKMVKGRQSLVTPLILPRQQAIEKWRLEHPGEQNEIPKKEAYETQRGELVRSKSEKILADLFNSMDIPYIYEPKLHLKDKDIYPDFMLFNVKSRKSAYWEHFGRLDKQEYVLKNYLRINDYERSGYLLGEDFFFSMETEGRPLDVKLAGQKLERWLEH